MVDTVSFQSTPTGSEAPVVPGSQAPVSTSGERPAWLPEHMKSPEDLAKAFSETQAALTRSQQELAALKKPVDEKKPDEPKPNEPKPEEKKPDELDIPKDDEKPVMPTAADFAPYTDEFNTTGDVAPESRTKIVESLKGVFGDDAASIVNDFIEGKKTLRTNATNSIKEIAGGDEGYTAMQMWAKDNLQPGEKTAYNNAVNSGDFHAASLAVNGLKAKYDAANGKAPNLVNGDSAINTQAGFASVHALVEAQRDPRYGKDPDYTKSVQDRLMRSNI